eukprot:scaffold19245_cov199-Amphora_coffeaeformis.AAC.29
MRNLFQSNIRRVVDDSNSSKIDVRSFKVEVGCEVIEEEEDLKIHIVEPKRPEEEAAEDEGRQEVDDDDGDEPTNEATVADVTTTEPFLDSWLTNNVITDQENGMIAMFNELWHEIEGSSAGIRDSPAIRMLATDPDDSMVAMFREIGTAARDELASGRRALTMVLMMQMEWAIHRAVGVWNKAGLLKDPTAEQPDGDEEALVIQRGEGSKLGHSFYEI